MFRFVWTPIVRMLRQLHCFRLCVDRGVFSALQQSLVPFHLCGQGYMALSKEPKWQCYLPVHCGRARRGRLPPMWPEYRACGWWQSSQLNSRRRAGSSGAMWITLFIGVFRTETAFSILLHTWSLVQKRAVPEMICDWEFVLMILMRAWSSAELHGSCAVNHP